MADKKTVTVPLDSPVEHDGKTYASLTFRKMKAKDLVAGDLVAGEARKSFAVFASMADIPIQVIEELEMDDFEKLAEAVTPLMGKSAAAAATAQAKAAATLQ